MTALTFLTLTPRCDARLRPEDEVSLGLYRAALPHTSISRCSPSPPLAVHLALAHPPKRNRAPLSFPLFPPIFAARRPSGACPTRRARSLLSFPPAEAHLYPRPTRATTRYLFLSIYLLIPSPTFAILLPHPRRRRRGEGEGETGRQFLLFRLVPSVYLFVALPPLRLPREPTAFAPRGLALSRSRPGRPPLPRRAPPKIRLARWMRFSATGLRDGRFPKISPDRRGGGFGLEQTLGGGA